MCATAAQMLPRPLKLWPQRCFMPCCCSGILYEKAAIQFADQCHAVPPKCKNKVVAGLTASEPCLPLYRSMSTLPYGSLLFLWCSPHSKRPSTMPSFSLRSRGGQEHKCWGRRPKQLSLSNPPRRLLERDSLGRLPERLLFPVLVAPFCQCQIPLFKSAFCSALH